jgi:lipopolysaccharide/colanic/teichoic acid biosynthesis glycosyltransferase
MSQARASESGPKVEDGQKRSLLVGAHAIERNAPWIDAGRTAPAGRAVRGVDSTPRASTAASSRFGSKLGDASCRALDILGALCMLVLLSPLLVVLAIAVRLDSPGPVLFRQRRLGRDLEPFTVKKFRTMHHGATHDRHREFVLGLIKGDNPQPGATGSPYKIVGDQRVTRVGRVLRRSSLDELPQLLNVLRGEMSLVGPRPPIPYEVDHYPAHWFARFAVKPGITGLWQVNGRSEVPLEEMVRLDVEYARRRSLWFNLTLLARTVPAVLSGRGAS